MAAFFSSLRSFVHLSALPLPHPRSPLRNNNIWTIIFCLAIYVSISLLLNGRDFFIEFFFHMDRSVKT